MGSHLYVALKTQQSNEKVGKKRLIGENKRVVSSGESQDRGGGEQEVQTIGHKISFKDILYNPGMIASIL